MGKERSSDRSTPELSVTFPSALVEAGKMMFVGNSVPSLITAMIEDFVPQQKQGKTAQPSTLKRTFIVSANNDKTTTIDSASSLSTLEFPVLVGPRGGYVRRSGAAESLEDSLEPYEDQ